MNCTNTDSRKKRSTKYPTPQNPKNFQDILKFRDHDGLTFGVYECVDFWMPVVSMVPHLQNSDAPGRVGWIKKEAHGDYWMGVLRGIALELIRQYVLSVVVHPGQYSEEKRLHDLRVVMGREFEFVGLANVPVLDTRGPVPDWMKLTPLGEPAVPVCDDAGMDDRREDEEQYGARETDEARETEARMLAAYEKALPEEQLQEIAAQAREKSKAFGEYAVEAYYDEISKIDDVDIIGILGTDYVQASAEALAAATETPVICGPAFTSQISEQWAASNMCVNLS